MQVVSITLFPAPVFLYSLVYLSATDVSTAQLAHIWPRGRVQHRLAHISPRSGFSIVSAEPVATFGNIVLNLLTSMLAIFHKTSYHSIFK